MNEGDDLAHAANPRHHGKIYRTNNSEHEARWLAPAATDPAVLRPLLVPCPPERLRVWPVGTAVNATRHDGPDLMASVALPDA